MLLIALLIYPVGAKGHAEKICGKWYSGGMDKKQGEAT
jgi:hypothetical protein